MSEKKRKSTKGRTLSNNPFETVGLDVDTEQLQTWTQMNEKVSVAKTCDILVVY